MLYLCVLYVCVRACVRLHDMYMSETARSVFKMSIHIYYHVYTWLWRIAVLCAPQNGGLSSLIICRGIRNDGGMGQPD